MFGTTKPLAESIAIVILWFWTLVYSKGLEGSYKLFKIGKSDKALEKNLMKNDMKVRDFPVLFLILYLSLNYIISLLRGQ